MLKKKWTDSKSLQKQRVHRHKCPFRRGPEHRLRRRLLLLLLAAENATAETVAVNTTDTDIITATENLSKYQTGTLNPAISDPILVDLSSPGDSHSTTGARSVTDARVMMTVDSSTVADVSPSRCTPAYSSS